MYTYYIHSLITNQDILGYSDLILYTKKHLYYNRIALCTTLKQFIFAKNCIFPKLYRKYSLTAIFNSIYELPCYKFFNTKKKKKKKKKCDVLCQ